MRRETKTSPVSRQAQQGGHVRLPILGEVGRSRSSEACGSIHQGLLEVDVAIDGLGSEVEVLLHGAKERGGGRTSQLLEYQTDVRRGRFDRPRVDSQCGFQGSALGNEENLAGSVLQRSRASHRRGRAKPRRSWRRQSSPFSLGQCRINMKDLTG